MVAFAQAAPESVTGLPQELVEALSQVVQPGDDVAAIVAAMSLSEQERAWELATGRARRPLTFEEFIRHVHPRFLWPWHVRKLVALLQRVADGEITRLMVFMPPRHGKSELVSRLFPAYYLYRFPDRFVGLASYGQALADKMSRAARGFYRATGRVSPGNADAVQYWETGGGGGFWATGIGGPATGMGFSLGIVDDYVKNHKDAASKLFQENQRDWWDSVWNTRLAPGGALVVMATRWNVEDLAGYLLKREGEAAKDEWEVPERWHVLNFPALAEPVDRGRWPSTVTLEEDEREPGTPLWPERFPVRRLNQIRLANAYFWAALFQQRPTLREGNIIKRAWLQGKLVPKRPQYRPGMRLARYWDTASTQDGGDYTVGVLMLVMRGELGPIYVVCDVIRGQWDPGERDKWIKRTALKDGKLVQQWLQQEPGSGGKDQALRFVANLSGFAAFTETAEGDKVVRLEGFASAAASGFVYYVDGHWNTAWLDELFSFRGLETDVDDQVDGTSGAFNALAREAMFGGSQGYGRNYT